MLLKKEIAEHWVALALLLALMGFLFAVLAMAGIGKGSPAFEVFRTYLTLCVPFAAWFLGGRLVRREYGGSTQLFLDALPIRRSWVLTAKYLLGASVLAACVAPAFVLCWLAALSGSDVTGPLLGIMLLRTFAYLWFVHAACFVLGFLGRYRTMIVLLGFFAVALVSSKTDVEIAKFGPFALVDHTFPFERSVVPTARLAATCAGAAVLTLVAYGLAALQEGSVAARLAHQMSQREKAFMGLIFVASLFGAFVFFEKRRKDPFAPPVAAEVATADVRVVVGAGSRMTEDEASGFAKSVHDQVDAMREYLGIGTLPPIFVFTRHGLDVNRFEHGTIENEAGVVVRVNYPAEGWDARLFNSWLAVHLVGEHTNGNARREPTRWILDGFGPFWAGSSRGEEPLDTDEQMLLRALYGAPRGVSREDLDAWESFREREGEAVASAVAWSGLRVLALRHGAEVARAFLADALGTPSPKDFRAHFGDDARTAAERVERHAGVSYEAFLAEWNADLSAARERHRSALDAIPRVTAAVESVEVSAGSRSIEYTATLTPAPPGTDRVRFEWIIAGPFNQAFEAVRVEADDVAYADAAKGRRLPQSERVGARVAWRIAYSPAALGCAVVSPVRRIVLE